MNDIQMINYRGVVKRFAISEEDYHLWLPYYKKEMFSCEFYKFFMNTFFTEHLRATVSVISYIK